MDKETLELLVTIIGGIFIVIATFIYYTSPKLSTCNRCGKEISIRKKDRYWTKVNGENVALCKSCHNKRPVIYYTQQKSDVVETPMNTSPEISNYEPAKICYACTVLITSRMKEHSLEISGVEQRLCSKCNRYIKSKVKDDLSFYELLTKEFLTKYSDVKSAEELTILYGKTIDLDSDEWNNHILRHTKFHDWEALRDQALKESNNQRVIAALKYLRRKPKS